MAELPDDDVPTMTGAPRGRPAELPSDDESESESGSDDVTTTAEAGPPVQAPRRLPARAPPPPPVPRTQRPPSSSPPSRSRSAEDDDSLDDSITTMAPRLPPSLPGMGISVGVVIHTVADDELEDELDQTEVRKPMAPRPAAGVPSSRAAPSTQPQGDDDDGVTTASQAPRGGSAPHLLASLGIAPSSAPATEPQVPTTQSPSTDLNAPTRPGVVIQLVDSVEEPLTQPGGEPTTRPGPAPALPRLDGYANDADAVGIDAEDLTKRDATSDAFEEDVVTTVGVLPSSGPVSIPDSTLDDATAGDTKHVTTLRKPLAVAPVCGDDDDDLEPPENKTAVMANAPLQRIIAEVTGEPLPIGSATGGSAAPRLAPGSDSGLRLAGQSDPPSGVARAAPPIADLRPYAATEAAFPALPPQPSVRDVELGKGPRYGLLVAIVALISIVVPVTLFVVLQGRTDEAVAVGVPAAAVPEVQQHDAAVRGKADKKLVAASTSASAAPSTRPLRLRR